MAQQTSEEQLKKINVDSYKQSTNFFLKLTIKGIDIVPTIVNSLIIREYYNYLTSRLSIALVDTGIFLDKFPLEEEDEIEVQIALNREQDPIKAVYYVESFTLVNTGSGLSNSNLVEISAVLKNKGLFKPNITRSFGSLKSSELFSKIASEVGYKADIRVTSNDSMKWLQINSNTYYFLKNVLERAYVSSDDSVLGYTQWDSNLVYTTLNKEISKEVKYEVLFSSTEALNEEPDKPNKTKDAKEYIFYNDFEMINISSLINKAEGGYGDQIVYYEDGSEVNNILSSNNHKLSTHSSKLKKDIGLVTKIDYMGSSNNRNLHKNFLSSIIQNNRNILDFFSDYLMINIKPRTDLKLLQKVNIKLLGANGVPDDVHSGEYLIGGIIYMLSSKANFTMKLLLYRNGHNYKYSMLESKDINLG